VDREEGDEPDYRFTLANERTFLAWIRTSLGLLAGGVAVRQLAEPFGVTGSRRLLAVLSISSSMVFAVGAYLRWVTVQSAVRRGEPLPPARLVPVAASAVVSIALAAVILILL
jgi:putative membrane protein